MSKKSAECRRPPVDALKSLRNPEIVRVFVGTSHKEFKIPRQLLCSSSPFFRKRLVHHTTRLNIIYLQDVSPSMFSLFVAWLYHHENLGRIVEEVESKDHREELHWSLIELHLFAAQIQTARLQDSAMDAIQDLYLRYNWELGDDLVTYVYNKCEPLQSCRLRKWIVAMTAWTLFGGLDKDETAKQIGGLFERCPGFWRDYVAHLSKTSRSKISLQFKNPQLRLPSNNMKTDERQFGFRQCSFHTHRSLVGQGRCPHSLTDMPPSLSPLSTSSHDNTTDDSNFGSVLGHELLSPKSMVVDIYTDMI